MKVIEAEVFSLELTDGILQLYRTQHNLSSCKPLFFFGRFIWKCQFAPMSYRYLNSKIKTEHWLNAMLLCSTLKVSSARRYASAKAVICWAIARFHVHYDSLLISVYFFFPHPFYSPQIGMLSQSHRDLSELCCCLEQSWMRFQCTRRDLARNSSF